MKTNCPGHVLILICMLAATVGGQVSDKVLLQGGRIVPVVGEEVPEGSILIEDGKITAMGADVKAPFDAKVIDVKGKVLFPGMIDALTSSGLDRPNENIDVAPYLHTADAIDPSDRYFEEALRNGLTSIHISQGNNCVVSGMSRVVRPLGLSVQEMTVQGDGGVKIGFAPKSGYDRAGQMAVLREAFDELDRYLDDLAEKLYEEDLKKKGDTLKVGPKEARKRGKKLVTLEKIDDKHRNLVRLREGKVDCYAWCAMAMDIASALATADKTGFSARTTLVVGSECFKAARAVKKHTKDSGRPVIIPSGSMVHTERDRITDEETSTFLPRVFSDEGIPFALGNLSQPWYQAARCVRNGVSRGEALESITLNAAKAIGMGDRLGSLEVGKDGNVLILSGDPLGVSTWVEGSVIEGRLVYERSKDKRLRDLFEGIEMTAEEARRAEDAKKAKGSSGGKKEDPAKESSGKKSGEKTKPGSGQEDGKKKDSKEKKKDGDK